MSDPETLARIGTPDALVLQLDTLRRRAARGTGKAKVGLDDLVRAIGVPRSTLHTYLSGSTFPPADVLDSVVIALGGTQEEQSAWAGAWERASAWLARSRSESDEVSLDTLFNTSVSIADQVDPDHSIRSAAVRTMALHDRTMIGPDRRKQWTRSQETLYATADGSDRSITLIGPNPQADLSRVRVVDAINCAPQHIRQLTEPRIVVVEMFFDRRLAAGETYTLEFRTDYTQAYISDDELAAAGIERASHTHVLNGFRRTGPLFVSEVVFQPDDVPVNVRQVYRNHKDDEGEVVGPLPVNQWHCAQIALDHPAAGVHGIEWDWSS